MKRTTRVLCPRVIALIVPLDDEETNEQIDRISTRNEQQVNFAYSAQFECKSIAQTEAKKKVAKLTTLVEQNQKNVTQLGEEVFT